MKHKVTEATLVTFQCVNILILSDNREEKCAFGPQAESDQVFIDKLT